MTGGAVSGGDSPNKALEQRLVTGFRRFDTVMTP